MREQRLTSAGLMVCVCVGGGGGCPQEARKEREATEEGQRSESHYPPKTWISHVEFLTVWNRSLLCGFAKNNSALSVF